MRLLFTTRQNERSGFSTLRFEAGTTIADLDGLAGIADRSVDEIVVEDLLEHLDQRTGLRLLHECRRLLVPGASLRVVTPDLQALLTASGAQAAATDPYWLASGCERFNLLLQTLGACWLYDESELARTADMVGLNALPRAAGAVLSKPLALSTGETLNLAFLDITLRKPDRRLHDDSQPLVSIAIPSYKPRYFARALQSALDQSYRNIEVVICDDCPDDGIQRIAEEFVARDERVRYLRNPQRLRRDNLTKCFVEARGEFFRLLCDDDVLACDAVERMLDCYRRHPDITLVTSRRRRIDENDQPLPDIFETQPPVTADAVIEGLSLGSALLTSLRNFVGEPTTAMFRKAEIAHIRPDYGSLDGQIVDAVNDVAVWLNLATRGNTAYLMAPLSDFRIHAGQNQQYDSERLMPIAVHGMKTVQASWQRLGFTAGQPLNTIRWQPLGNASTDWQLRTMLADRSGWTDARIEPPSAAGHGLERDWKRLAEALRLIDLGRTDEGFTQLVAMARSGTDCWRVFAELGHRAEQDGDIEGAIELHHAAVARASIPDASSLDLARLLVAQGREEEACAALTPYLEHHPNSPAAKLIRAAAEASPGRDADSSCAPDKQALEKVVVVVPLHRETLSAAEHYSLARSLQALSAREIVFVGPESLNIDCYTRDFPGIPYIPLDDNHFASIKGYNRLMMNPAFYDAFSGFEYMLILQPDAIVLQDALDEWCARGYDYVGAPWPDGYALSVGVGRFAGANARNVRLHVGNGGLSLRRIASCTRLLGEYPEIVELFETNGASEDLFFSLLGQLATDFFIPDEETAARFSLERQPSSYFTRNGGIAPMGGHKWWKNEPGFWATLLRETPEFLADEMQQSPAFELGPQQAIVTMSDGSRIAVPDSLDHITPYVLLEQGDWFEDELKYLRHILKPGDNAIDIGANHGVYTISMARKIAPGGHVWAFEPASATAGYLAQSIVASAADNVTLDRHALSNRTGTVRFTVSEHSELNSVARDGDSHLPSETVPLTTLDHCLDTYAWQDIAVMKIDAEGEEENILAGGHRFFTSLSPLIEYEIKVATNFNLDLVNAFAALGYDAYRLVPGLAAIVPFDPSFLDPFSLNLFGCKPDRAAHLAGAGALVTADMLAAGRRDQGDDDWQRSLSGHPYARLLMPRWSAAQHSPERKIVETALAAYQRSRDTSIAMTERYLALKESFEALRSLCAAQPTHLRLLSFARVARDFGARWEAVQALSKLFDSLVSRLDADFSEPFLAPDARFEQLDPTPNLGNWLAGGVLESIERLESYSSFYNDVDKRKRLQLILNLGFASEEMRRRLELMNQRYRLAPPQN